MKGQRKDGLITAKVLSNRAEIITNWLKPSGKAETRDLSIYDLCRLFEVSPLGMRKFLEYHVPNVKCSKRNHPAETRKMLEEEESNFIKEHSGDQYPYNRGMLRTPMRFNSGHDKMNKNNVIKATIKRLGADWRKKAEQMGDCLTIVVPDEYLDLVYELRSIGFKRSEILDYVSAKNNGGKAAIPTLWTEAICDHYAELEKQRPKVTIQRKTRKGDSYDFNLPHAIASDEELAMLLQDGATDQQIQMITGDQLVTIVEARERILKKRYQTVKRDKDERYAFTQYVYNERMSMPEIADKMGCSRAHVQHLIDDFLNKYATDEEKKKCEDKRKRSARLKGKNAWTGKQKEE